MAYVVPYQVGSGEIPALVDDEWEDIAETVEYCTVEDATLSEHISPKHCGLAARKRNSLACPVYGVRSLLQCIKISLKKLNILITRTQRHYCSKAVHRTGRQWNERRKRNDPRHANGSRFGCVSWATTSSGESVNVRPQKKVQSI